MKHTELAHKLLHLLFQSLGGHEIVSTRYGHLDQGTLANKVWLSLKKIVECAELLRYALDAIQAIDSKDDFLAPIVIFHAIDQVLNTRLEKSSLELCRLDADGTGLQRYLSATVD